jgi:hypothetical protein
MRQPKATLGIWQFVKNRRKLKKMMPVYGVVMRATYSDESDDEAVETVRPAVEANRKAAKAMLDHVADILLSQRGYVEDRTYRLLTAALEGTSPADISGEQREPFMRERDLGRMPLTDAFGLLAELAPGLRAVERTVKDGAHAGAGDVSTRAMPPMPIQEIDSLVGPTARSPDPLARSEVAVSIVVAYLRAIGGGRGHPDLHASLFAYRRSGPTARD